MLERGELLSVFPSAEREPAGRVLDALVGARLLTAYDEEVRAGEPGRERLEVAHESLLEAWPRLVRWRTQDEGGALLRDQLRQAATLWQDKNRSEELLWTGAAYRELALWRERYPGGLTATEESFAEQARRRVGRTQRRRRLATAALLAAVATVAITTSVLWRNSERSRRTAEREVRQRQAAELLALGRVRLDEHPMGALAHAIASLERVDNLPARRFAIEALWKGPPAHFLTDPVLPFDVAWSPDGRWLSLGGTAGLVLLDRDSGKRLPLAPLAEAVVGFSNDGTRVVTRSANQGTLRLLSLPDGEVLETWPGAPRRAPVLLDRRLLTFSFEPERKDGRVTAIVRERSIDGGPEKTVGRWRARRLTGWGADPDGERLYSLQDGRLLEDRLGSLDAAPRVLGRHEGDVTLRTRWTDPLVTANALGEVRLWDAATGRVERVLRSPAQVGLVALDPARRHVAVAPQDALTPRSFFVFDLEAPAAADPVPLVQKQRDWLNTMAFHPQGHFLASGQSDTVVLWNLATRRSLVLRGQKGVGIAVAFTSDGRLVSTSDEGKVRLWSLEPRANEPLRELWSASERRPLVGYSLEIDRQDRFAIVAKRFLGQLVVVPLDGSSARVLPLARGRGGPTLSFQAIDREGRSAALAYAEFGNPGAGSIRVVNLETGEETTLRAPTTDGACREDASVFGAADVPIWLPDGRFVSEGVTGLRVWDLANGSICRDTVARRNLGHRRVRSLRGRPHHLGVARHHLPRQRAVEPGARPDRGGPRHR